MELFHHLPVPAFHLDRDGTILQVNSHGASLLKLPEQSLLQIAFTDLLPEDSRKKFTDFFHQIRTAGSASCRVLLLLPESGRSPVVIKGSSLAREDALLLLDHGQEFEEQTEDAQTLAILQEAQYHHNPCGILLVNDRMEMVSFNEAFIKMWEISPELQATREQGASLQAVLSQLADPEGFSTEMQRLYRERDEVSSGEIQLMDGRTFYRQTYPIVSADIYRGRIWYFIDVTELKRANNQFEEQQIFVNGMLDHIQDGIIACDNSGSITILNRTSRKLYRCSLAGGEELSESELLETVNRQGKDSSPLKAALARTLAGTVLQNDEFVLEFPDGTTRTLSVNGRAMSDAGNQKLGAVITLHDITDLEKARNRLHFYAYHDTLTQLPNRRLFHDLLQQSLKQAKRSSKLVGVLFVDLDNFKFVNDRFGHDTGDQLLASIATTFQKNLRDSDMICRWGGDEFVIGLPDNTSREGITRVAEKLCRRVETVIDKINPEFRVSISIGVSIFPDHGSDPDLLIRNADMALYIAKRHGKNCYEVFLPDTAIKL